MAQKKISQKGLAQVVTFNVTGQKVVNLKLKMRYDELVASVNLLQALHADVTVLAKVPNGMQLNLGLFKLKALNIDKDGNSVIVLSSLCDSVNLDKIGLLLQADEESGVFQVCFKTVIEIEMKEGAEDVE